MSQSATGAGRYLFERPARRPEITCPSRSRVAPASRDQGVDDPGLPAFSPSVGYDLGESLGNAVVHRQWIEGAFDPCQRPKALGADPLIPGQQHTNMKLGERHHGHRGLIRQGGQCSALLLANEDRGVEQSPHSSSIVEPRAAWTQGRGARRGAGALLALPRVAGLGWLGWGAAGAAPPEGDAAGGACSRPKDGGFFATRAARAWIDAAS